ncbi:MAG: hypothetical protein Q9167_006162 [Letrouitia subvulpina]
MPGAGKKRAKAEHKKPEIDDAQSRVSAHPLAAEYDGPGSRPGSSAPGDSRGRAPSNAPPSVGGGQFGEKYVQSSSRATGETHGHLRDPARDPAQEQPPINRRVEWGGNAFNYFSTDAGEEIKLRVDLDKERGTPPRPNARQNIHAVTIKPAAKQKTIHLSNVRAYLEGKAQFGPEVFEAINFLDHLLRETPGKKLINIKRSYFGRIEGRQRESLGGGVEAMRGVYQSIRMAEGKRLVINVDVSHTTFWGESSFELITLQLCGLDKAPAGGLDGLQVRWRREKGAQRDNFIFLAMKRLKRNTFFVKHGQRPEKELDKEYKVADVLPQSAREYTFELKGTNEKITLETYYRKKYNVILSYPELPVIKTTKGSTVFPMELCKMKYGQRYPYKLTEQQTSSMIKFAVQRPAGRLDTINTGLSMLNWQGDEKLRKYGFVIDPNRIKTNARILEPPQVLFGGGKVLAPRFSGRWDLRGQTFLAGNEAPLFSWGVAVMPSQSPRENIQKPQAAQFIKTFMAAYKSHGGTITGDPVWVNGISDEAKAVETLYHAVGNKNNVRPQMMMFILPNKDVNRYLRIKKSCDCRYGIVSQCVQAAHAIKNSAQYHSNVLMKFNAKLGGTTCRVALKTAGHFTRPTMIIGADVSHAAPGVAAPSYAAVTISMDKAAARYNAGVQTNGHRVEMITTKNLEDMLRPQINHWMQNVSGGRLPDHVYYFRDGVSEGQYTSVLKYEVADIKRIFEIIGETRKDFSVKFTVVVAEKRHHIRFFPQPGTKASDNNGNPVPGTIVERDVTHPHEYDMYLCSHKAIQGTARPTHYHILMDEQNVSPDEFQKFLYEHSYQYQRATTPVSLFPAVYYAHLASNRARAHEDIAESQRRERDLGDPSKSTSKEKLSAEHVKPLMLIPEVNKMRYAMWYI